MSVGTPVERPQRQMMRPTFLATQAELARLDAHFVRVLRLLHTCPPSGLTRVQRRARAAHVERLEAYRKRRVFPKNRRFPGRLVPHFIDASGTRCAMGHLVEASGARDLVQHIASARNYARIRELTNIPELVSWLEANGLTVDEAATIQPTYCGSAAANCVCDDAYDYGVVRGTVGTLVDGGKTLTVDAVYGLPTNAKVGDVVPLDDGDGLAGPNDIAFATWFGGSSAVVQFVAHPAEAGDPSVIVPLSACSFSEFHTIPGPVPMQVIDQALAVSLSSTGPCEQVLAQYDPAWAVVGCPGQGGTGGTTPGSGGVTSGGTSGIGGSQNGGTTSGGAPSDGGPRDAGTHAGTEPSGGCSFAAHPALGAEAVIAISAAVVLGARRRSHRH